MLIPFAQEFRLDRKEFAMKPIPTEMRKRILDDCDNGMTEKVAAEKWKVSMSFITKLKRKVRETGSMEPIKPKTGPKPKLEPHYELLRQIALGNSRRHIGRNSGPVADQRQSSNRRRCVANIAARL
jgi:hypothetical protein